MCRARFAACVAGASSGWGQKSASHQAARRMDGCTEARYRAVSCGAAHVIEREQFPSARESEARSTWNMDEDLRGASSGDAGAGVSRGGGGQAPLVQLPGPTLAPCEGTRAKARGPSLSAHVLPCSNSTWNVRKAPDVTVMGERGAFMRRLQGSSHVAHGDGARTTSRERTPPPTGPWASSTWNVVKVLGAWSG